MNKTLLFLLIPITLFAQEITQQQEIKNERTWSIKLNVIQLVDAFAFPTVMIGTEKRINRWFSLNAEAGYQSYDGQKDPENIIYKQHGFKANIEARSYVISMFNPNAAYTWVTKNRHDILFEPYIGIGGVHRDNYNTPRINTDGLEEHSSEYFLHEDKSEDSGYFGNFTAGIRFGYIF